MMKSFHGISIGDPNGYLVLLDGVIKLHRERKECCQNTLSAISAMWKTSISYCHFSFSKYHKDMMKKYFHYLGIVAQYSADQLWTFPFIILNEDSIVCEKLLLSQADITEKKYYPLHCLCRDLLHPSIVSSLGIRIAVITMPWPPATYYTADIIQIAVFPESKCFLFRKRFLDLSLYLNSSRKAMSILL